MRKCRWNLQLRVRAAPDRCACCTHVAGLLSIIARDQLSIPVWQDRSEGFVRRLHNQSYIESCDILWHLVIVPWNPFGGLWMPVVSNFHSTVKQFWGWNEAEFSDPSVILWEPHLSSQSAGHVRTSCLLTSQIQKDFDQGTSWTSENCDMTW